MKLAKYVLLIGVLSFISLPNTVPAQTINIPSSIIIATPPNGPTPLQVNFSAARSFDPDGSIVSYQWNFGDGTTGKREFEGHTYSQDGRYEVTLTVTDNSGISSTSSITILAGSSGQCGISTLQPSPFQTYGTLSLAWDGDFIWNSGKEVGNPSDTNFTQFNPSGSIIQQFTVGQRLVRGFIPISFPDMVWDNRFFAGLNINELFFVDRNGQTFGHTPLQNPPVQNLSLVGIAWDSTNYWVVGHEVKKGIAYLMKVTKGGKVILSVELVIPTIEDLAWDGIALWGIDPQNDKLYKINRDTGAIQISCNLPVRRPTAMTWDGFNFWMVSSGFLHKLLVKPPEGYGPNFDITDFTSPGSSSPGQPSTFTATLKNTSTVPASQDVKWKVSDSQDKIIHLETRSLFLKEFTETTLTFTHTFTTGTFTVEFSTQDDVRTSVVDVRSSSSPVPTTCNFEVIESFNAGIPLQGLAYTQGNLYGWDRANSTLIAINPITRSGQTINTTQLTLYPSGVGSDLTNLIFLNGKDPSSITKFDPISFQKTAIKLPQFFLSDDLAWDGNDFWILGTKQNPPGFRTLFKISTSGTVLLNKEIPFRPATTSGTENITSDRNYLYGADYDTGQIHKFDLQTANLIETCLITPSASGSLHGLAWDGTYLWASDTDGWLYKLKAESTTPRPGPPIPPPSTDPCLDPNDPNKDKDWHWSNLAKNNWGFKAVEADKLHQAKYCGDGIRIAIIEFGFDEKHPAFNYCSDESKCRLGYLNVVAKGNTFGKAELGDNQNIGAVEDHEDHGTAVAGFAWQIAPRAKFILIKVCWGCSFNDYDAGGEIIEALNLAKEARADVVTISVTVGITNNGEVPANGESAISRAFSDAAERMIITAAAGNSTSKYPVMPSDGRNVLSIASIDKQASFYEIRSEGSPSYITRPLNYPFKPDIAAPGGIDFLSSLPLFSLRNCASLLKCNKYADFYQSSGDSLTGSSYAAPHVAGVSALLLAAAGDNVSAVKSAILNSADPVPDQYHPNKIAGCGRVVGYRALQNLLGKDTSYCDRTGTTSSGNSIERALDPNKNGIIDDNEILEAVRLWVTGQVVPGTQLAIDDSKILDLVTMWVKGTRF